MKLVAVQKKVENLKKDIEETEAYKRKDTMILSGASIPEFSPGENCINIVRTLLQDKVKLTLEPTYISTSHRIRKKSDTHQTNRINIIVKFCRRDVKRNILAVCCLLNQLNSTLTRQVSH